ncbi:hypothetical protein [Roseomonas genomospecies 6]|nr:hypothetical protein [Roseomonas genomospecies 6]
MEAAKDDGRRETLLRLKEACDALQRKKVEITGADVQRYIEGSYGREVGPKAQSIRNDCKKKGVPGYLGMWQYLEARKREQVFSKKPNAGASNAHLRAIDSVEDPNERALLRDLYDRALLAEKKVVRAQQLFARIVPGVDFAAWLKDGSTGREGSGTGSSLTIKSGWITALEQTLSSLTDVEKLSRCGLEYDGKRVRRKGGLPAVLLELGVVEHLAEMHQYLVTNARPDEIPPKQLVPFDGDEVDPT